MRTATAPNVPAALRARHAATVLGLLALVLQLSPAPAAQGVVPAGSATAPDLTRAVQTARAEQTMTSATYEHRLLRWTNVQRRRHGLREVRPDACADQYAETWTRRLVRSGGELVHRDQSVVLEGCKATAAGEVLARGQVSPRRMVRMWMNSPGHRAILLSRTYRRIGLGAQRMRDGSWLATGNYLRR
jgi:uncharacterized protein YkwD